MDTSDVYTQVFQSLMPLISDRHRALGGRDNLDDAYKRASQVQEEERAGETPP